MPPSGNEAPPEGQSEGRENHQQSDGTTYRRQAIGVFAIVSPELYSNRKVRKAGAFGREVFVFALARNAARGRTGSFQASDLDVDYLADQLQISEQDASQGLQRACAAGLLEIDDGTAYILGWDESWARRALGESEHRQLRRKELKEKEARGETKIEKKIEKEIQIQKKRSPDKVRAPSGQPGVYAPLSPSMSSQEEARARKIIARIASYTGNHYFNGSELEHVVKTMRRGYPDLHLEALAAYICDGAGRNWVELEDNNSNFYMRDKCHPFGVFTEKNIREQMSLAVATTLDGLFKSADLTGQLKTFEAQREAQKVS